MAKDKKKTQKQNKSEVTQTPPITMSAEELQHLIAHAIIEADEIKEETLGIELSVGKTLANAKEWNINGENVTISVERV